MNNSEKLIASVLLAIGAIFGISGSIFIDPPVLQTCLYEISSIALVAGTVFIGIKYCRLKNDLLATGFLTFAIAETVMTAGMPLGMEGGQPSFGAGMALYVPGLLFISASNTFPKVVRLFSIIASILFGIAAAKIFIGLLVPSTDPLPGAGYGFLVLSIVGWIWTFYRVDKNES